MADALRRGFKTEAEDLAQLVRAELGLTDLGPLDCAQLADTWGIPIVSLGELREDGASDWAVRHLLAPAAGFSALTICVGPRRLIVYNPRHSARRRANSLAHELSHHILEHEPAPAIGIGGCRRWNGVQEAPRPTGSPERSSYLARAHSPGSVSTTTSRPAHATSGSASSSSHGV